MKKLYCFNSVLKSKVAKSLVLALQRAIADGGNMMKRSPLRTGSQLETETPHISAKTHPQLF